MNFRQDWRERRNMLNQGYTIGPMHYSISNYSTDSQISKKSEMEPLDEDIISKIHSIPDPLKKNLADTVITAEKNKGKDKSPPREQKQYYYDHNMPTETMENGSNDHRNDFSHSFAGITTFISNVFGAISDAMFYRRPKSPVPQYYDCFECDSHMEQEVASDTWQSANLGEQNKKRAPELTSNVSNDKMNNCRAAAAHCEDKLNTVRNLLTNKAAPNPTRVQHRKTQLRRPRRTFVEPSAVENNHEEKFTSDHFVSLPNDDFIEYFSVQSNQNQVFTEIDGPKMKTERIPIIESADIVTVLPDIIDKPQETCKSLAPIEPPTVIVKPESETDKKTEIILSCEDKMARLKSLLQEKRKKSNLNVVSSDSNIEPVIEDRLKKRTTIIPIEKKHDKRFKNPSRLVDKRMKSRMKKNIQDDSLFANEIDSEDISSIENSPRPISTLQRISETLPMDSVETDNDYFDELKGRFHSASTTDSEDSFQIVFSDSPKLCRMRRPSDCDSEDSFIVFEDSPDSCYTSNDVFGDHPTTEGSDSECSDSDSDISDSGCGVDVCKLSHTFSRTISDLTDESLYEDARKIESTVDNEAKDIQETEVSEKDVVDCAVRTFEEIESECESEKLKGLLIDEAKKLRRKDQPAKKVTFSEKPPKVHVMRVWSFAARQARAGHWEMHAVDRERFRRRIADVDMAVAWVLKPQHRSRVMFQRFMPWWNQQKRKEAAAEKKQKEEEERKRKEQERIEEEQKIIEEEQKIEADKIEEEEKEDHGDVKGEKNNKEVVEEQVGVKDDKPNTETKNGMKTSTPMEKECEKSKNNEKLNDVKAINKEIIAVNDKLTDLNLGFVVNEKIATT